MENNLGSSVEIEKSDAEALKSLFDPSCAADHVAYVSDKQEIDLASVLRDPSKIDSLSDSDAEAYYAEGNRIFCGGDYDYMMVNSPYNEKGAQYEGVVDPVKRKWTAKAGLKQMAEDYSLYTAAANGAGELDAYLNVGLGKPLGWSAEQYGKATIAEKAERISKFGNVSTGREIKTGLGIWWESWNLYSLGQMDTTAKYRPSNIVPYETLVWNWDGADEESVKADAIARALETGDKGVKFADEREFAEYVYKKSGAHVYVMPNGDTFSAMMLGKDKETGLAKYRLELARGGRSEYDAALVSFYENRLENQRNAMNGIAMRQVFNENKDVLRYYLMYDNSRRDNAGGMFSRQGDVDSILTKFSEECRQYMKPDAELTQDEIAKRDHYILTWQQLCQVLALDDNRSGFRIYNNSIMSSIAAGVGNTGLEWWNELSGLCGDAYHNVKSAYKYAGGDTPADRYFNQFMEWADADIRGVTHPEIFSQDTTFGLFGGEAAKLAAFSSVMKVGKIGAIVNAAGNVVRGAGRAAKIRWLVDVGRKMHRVAAAFGDVKKPVGGKAVGYREIDVAKGKKPPKGAKLLDGKYYVRQDIVGGRGNFFVEHNRKVEELDRKLAKALEENKARLADFKTAQAANTSDELSEMYGQIIDGYVSEIAKLDADIAKNLGSKYASISGWAMDVANELPAIATTALAMDGAHKAQGAYQIGEGFVEYDDKGNAVSAKFDADAFAIDKKYAVYDSLGNAVFLLHVPKGLSMLAEGRVGSAAAQMGARRMLGEIETLVKNGEFDNASRVVAVLDNAIRRNGALAAIGQWGKNKAVGAAHLAATGVAMNEVASVVANAEERQLASGGNGGTFTARDFALNEDQAVEALKSGVKMAAGGLILGEAGYAAKSLKAGRMPYLEAYGRVVKASKNADAMSRDAWLMAAGMAHRGWKIHLRAEDLSADPLTASMQVRREAMKASGEYERVSGDTFSYISRAVSSLAKEMTGKRGESLSDIRQDAAREYGEEYARIFDGIVEHIRKARVGEFGVAYASEKATDYMKVDSDVGFEAFDPKAVAEGVGKLLGVKGEAVRIGENGSEFSVVFGDKAGDRTEITFRKTDLNTGLKSVDADGVTHFARGWAADVMDGLERKDLENFTEDAWGDLMAKVDTLSEEAKSQLRNGVDVDGILTAARERGAVGAGRFVVELDGKKVAEMSDEKGVLHITEFAHETAHGLIQSLRESKYLDAKKEALLKEQFGDDWEEAAVRDMIERGEKSVLAGFFAEGVEALEAKSGVAKALSKTVNAMKSVFLRGKAKPAKSAVERMIDDKVAEAEEISKAQQTEADENAVRDEMAERLETTEAQTALVPSRLPVPDSVFMEGVKPEDRKAREKELNDSGFYYDSYHGVWVNELSAPTLYHRAVGRAVAEKIVAHLENVASAKDLAKKAEAENNPQARKDLEDRIKSIPTDEPLTKAEKEHIGVAMNKDGKPVGIVVCDNDTIRAGGKYLVIGEYGASHNPSMSADFVLAYQLLSRLYDFSWRTQRTKPSDFRAPHPVENYSESDEQRHYNLVRWNSLNELDRLRITLSTGWMIGRDGNWRREEKGVQIDKSLKVLSDTIQSMWEKQDLYTDAVIAHGKESPEAKHAYENTISDIVVPMEKVVSKQFADMYPRVKTMNILFSGIQRNSANTQGYYDSPKNRIVLNPSLYKNKDGTPIGDRGKKLDRNAADLVLRTLEHETQHFVQDEEDWPSRGTNSRYETTIAELYGHMNGEAAKQAGALNYFWNAGEVESRTAERRLGERKYFSASNKEIAEIIGDGMTADQVKYRRVPFWYDESVLRSLQIVDSVRMFMLGDSYRDLLSELDFPNNMECPIWSVVGERGAARYFGEKYADIQDRIYKIVADAVKTADEGTRIGLGSGDNAKVNAIISQSHIPAKFGPFIVHVGGVDGDKQLRLEYESGKIKIPQAFMKRTEDGERLPISAFLNKKDKIFEKAYPEIADSIVVFSGDVDSITGAKVKEPAWRNDNTFILNNSDGQIVIRNDRWNPRLAPEQFAQSLVGLIQSYEGWEERIRTSDERVAGALVPPRKKRDNSDLAFWLADERFIQANGVGRLVEQAIRNRIGGKKVNEDLLKRISEVVWDEINDSVRLFAGEAEARFLASRFNLTEADLSDYTKAETALKDTLVALDSRNFTSAQKTKKVLEYWNDIIVKAVDITVFGSSHAAQKGHHGKQDTIRKEFGEAVAEEVFSAIVGNILRGTRAARTSLEASASGVPVGEKSGVAAGVDEGREVAWDASSSGEGRTLAVSGDTVVDAVDAGIVQKTNLKWLKEKSAAIDEVAKLVKEIKAALAKDPSRAQSIQSDLMEKADKIIQKHSNESDPIVRRSMLNEVITEATAKSRWRVVSRRRSPEQLITEAAAARIVRNLFHGEQKADKWAELVNKWVAESVKKIGVPKAKSDEVTKRIIDRATMIAYSLRDRVKADSSDIEVMREVEDAVANRLMTDRILHGAMFGQAIGRHGADAEHRAIDEARRIQAKQVEDARGIGASEVCSLLGTDIIADIERLAEKYGNGDNLAKTLISKFSEKMIREDERFAGMTNDEFVASPVARAELARTVSGWLREVGRRLGWGQTREWAMREAARLQAENPTFGAVHMAIAKYADMLSDRLNRQSTGRLLDEIDKQIDKYADGNKALSVSIPDYERKIAPRLQDYWRYAKKAMRMTDEQVQSEVSKYNNVLKLTDSELLELKGKASNEIGDEATVARDNAVMRLNVLTRFGGLKNRTFAEAMGIYSSSIAKDLAGAVQEHLVRRNARLSDDARIRQAFIGELTSIRRSLKGNDFNAETNGSKGGTFLTFSVADLFKRMSIYLHEGSAAWNFVDSFRQDMSIGHITQVTFTSRWEGEMRKACKEIYGRNFEQMIPELMLKNPEYDKFSRSGWYIPEDGAKVEFGKKKVVKALPPDGTMPTNLPNHLSKANLIYIYAASQQADMQVNNFIWGRDAKYLQDIRDVIGPQGVAIANWLTTAYAEIRKELSPVSERICGMPILSPDERYCPLSFEGDEVSVDERRFSSNPFPAFLTRRVTHDSLRLKETTDAFRMFEGRIQDSGHYLGFAEIIDRMNTTLKHPKVQTAYSQLYGKKAKNDIYAQLADALNGGRKNADTLMSGVRNFITATSLFGNVGSAIKQVEGVGGWAVEMGLGQWVKNIVRNPITSAEVRDGLREIIDAGLFSTREHEGISEAMVTLMNSCEGVPEGIASRGYNWYKRHGMDITKWIDKFASMTMAGQYYVGRRNWYIEHGLKVEDAKRRALADTDYAIQTTQQSGRAEFLHSAQRAGTAGKMLTQFSGPAFVRWGIECESLHRAVVMGDKGAWGKLASRLIALHIICPALLTLAGTLSGIMFKREDEKMRDIVDKTKKDIIASCLTGPLGGWFIYGQILNAAAYEAVMPDVKASRAKSHFEAPVLSKLNSLRRMTQKLFTDVVEAAPWDYFSRREQEQIAEDAWRLFQMLFPAARISDAVRNAKELGEQ